LRLQPYLLRNGFQRNTAGIRCIGAEKRYRRCQVFRLLLIGQYAQRWHLEPSLRAGGVTGTVQRWRAIYDAGTGPKIMPLAHPSWRNSGWLKRNPWFETQLLPILRADVQQALR
jgi:uracil-DNA glycosylase